MAKYEYKCTNDKCAFNGLIKQVSIPMNEYDENKLPKCEKCNSKTVRVYSAFGHQTFGDGYRS